MSYSGSVEWLCEKGHHTVFGCWEDDPKECTKCHAKMAFRNSIDTTNGSSEDEPWSLPAPKQQTGWDDDWRYDHYGNRYAVKIPRYIAGGERWRALAMRQGHQP